MKLKILVIDDDDDIRKVTVDFFKKNGDYEILQAANGKVGIEKFERYNPDLVITVLNMPGVRGEEVARPIARYIEKNPEVKTKVIGIGAGAYLEQVAKAAGCDRLIKTPFHILQLQEAVEDLFRTWTFPTGC